MKVRLIFCPEWSRDDGGKTAVTSSSTSADVESANAENKVIYIYYNFVFKIKSLCFA